MVGRPRRRARLAALALQRDSRGGGALSTRLPVQPRDAEGGSGDSGLRGDEPQSGEYPPLHDDDGRGTAERAGEGGDGTVPDDGGGLRARGKRRQLDRPAGRTKLLSRLELPGGTGQPDVAHGYISPVVAGIAGVAETRLRDGHAALSPEKLTRAVELSLERALAILELSIDLTQKDALRFLQLQKEVLTSVLNTQARVASDTLRAKQTDRMAELLEKIKARRIS